MKQLIKTLFLVFLIIPLAQAQDDNLDKEIAVIATKHQNSVRLRWIVSDYETWNIAAQNGFTIERNEIGESNIVTLATNLKPLTASQWDQQFPQNEVAELAKGLLYNNSNQTSINDVQNLKDLHEFNQQEDSKHLFIMMTAERDYEIAKGLALAYEDTSADFSKEYYYRVIVQGLDSTSTIKAGIERIDLSETTTLPAPDTLTGFGDAVSIYVQWDEESLQEYYSTFDIERSINNVNWELCNNAPHISLSGDDVEMEKSMYRDLVPDPSLVYYFRVRGRTPFGTYGPYSDVIQLSCTPSKMALDCDFTGNQIINDDVVLNWLSFPDVYQDSILGFNVYRTPTISEKPVKINTSMLPSSSRAFTDTESISGNSYYFLEAVDPYGHKYRSREMIVRKEDYEAPAIPVNFSHELLDFNTLRLKWQLNTERDLEGYQVYYANTADGTFFKISDNTIVGNLYDFKMSEVMAVDSFYFKVASVDTRGNISENSETIAVARPDIFAPNRPVFSSANPMNDGVYLSWRFSGSDDVVRHELRRRNADGYHDWMTILSITAAEEDSYKMLPGVANLPDYIYLDESELEAHNYEYALIAIDDNGNEGTSNSLKVFPFIESVQGKVTNFEIELDPEPVPENSLLNTELDKLKGKDVSNYRSVSGLQYNAHLSWEAELDYTISHFQIYRSIGAAGMMAHRAVTPEEGLGLTDDVTFTESSGIQNFTIIDKDLNKGKRYTYYIVGVRRDGSETKRSTTLSKIIPSK